MFSDLIKVQQDLISQKKTQQYIGVFIGKVCHYRASDKAVRVTQVNDDSNYVTYWLKPSTGASAITTAIGDYVLFCFPTLDPKEGVYMDLFGKVYDSGTVTPEYVDTRIDLKIDDYDDEIKAYIASLNYTTMAAVQTWVLGQNYTTLAAVQTWVNAQNFVTSTSLASTLAGYVTNASLTSTLANYVLTSTLANYSTTTQSNVARQRSGHRYVANNFVQGSKGASIQVPDQWINRHITIYCLGSPLPGSGGSQDGGSAIGINIDGAASQNNSRITVGDLFYLKINTTANINFNGVNGITVNGTLNGSFLMGLRTCWRVEKTAATTYTLTNMNDFDFVPYS